MKRVLLALAALVCVNGAAFAFDPEDHVFYDLEKNEVTIVGDSGGRVVKYESMLEEFKAKKTKVKFKMWCASACTTFLRLPPEQICVYPQIEFLFHNPRYSHTKKLATESIIKLEFKKNPQWVQDYINNLGGMPGSSERLMTYAYAKKFIQTCED